MWVCGYEDQNGWHVSLFDTEHNARVALLNRAINFELNPGTEEYQTLVEAHTNIINRHITAREALSTPAIADVLSDAYFNSFVAEAKKEANQFGMIGAVAASRSVNPI